jgi:outer membrane protein assembly factor BamB
LLKAWPEKGPELLFSTAEIGKGYSAAVWVKGVLYVTGMIDTLDYLTAIGEDGAIIWQVPFGRSWEDSFPDTRCTPTVDGDRIYVISGMGEVACVSTSGDILWKVDVDETFEAKWHLWGVAESPLVIDNMVICTPVGEKASLVALNKHDGSLVWSADPVRGRRSYVSPTLYEYNGISLILAKSSTDLFAVDPANGNVEWSYHYSLLMPEDEIFINAGYDMTAAMLTLAPDGKSVSLKYTDHTFDNHFHGVVLVDGYLDGSNWFNNSQGRWVCMKWSTGEIKYVDEWKTKGNILYADGLLYVYEEKGTVGLVNPDKDGFEVISSFRVREGKGPHWAHMSIYDGKLLVRHGEVVMVYDIRDSNL